MIRRMIPALLLGLAGCGVLIWLGAWQVQRLAWKTEILDRIETRLAAEPVPVPPDPDPSRDQYLRVLEAGTIEPGELHVYTSAPGRGVGYRVIVPFRLGDGRLILLDRGFVPIGEKDTPRHLGAIRVRGSLLWPDETDSYTDAPDLARNIWFARDVAKMSAALGTAPVMLVTEASDDEAAPWALPVTIDIPNNHLQYAITWFGLAIAWAGMTLYWLWRIKSRTD
jgi:surfeit locus 1 family protein